MRRLRKIVDSSLTGRNEKKLMNFSFKARIRLVILQLIIFLMMGDKNA